MYKFTIQKKKNKYYTNQPKRKGTLVTPKERNKQNQFYLI